MSYDSEMETAVSANIPTRDDRILLVDDEQAVVEMTARMTERPGCHARILARSLWRSAPIFPS